MRASIIVAASALIAYAAFALVVPISRVLARWPEPYAADDAAMIARWDCAAALVARIPDGSSVVLDSELQTWQWKGPFVIPSYPRLDFAGDHPADFRIGLAVPGAAPFERATCAGTELEVIRVGP